MLPKLLTSIFGSRNERLLKQYRRTVQQINALEPKFEALQAFDRAAWRAEVLGHEELFLDLHATLPKELFYERELLICRM